MVRLLHFVEFGEHQSKSGPVLQPFPLFIIHSYRSFTYYKTMD